jgi:hypothetical protein
MATPPPEAKAHSEAPAGAPTALGNPVVWLTQSNKTAPGLEQIRQFQVLRWI